MAWAAADIDSAEITDVAADYPLLIGSHVLRDNKDVTNFGMKWVDGTGASAAYSGTDDVNATYPVTRSYDAFNHIDTRPTIDASETEWWLIAYAGDSSFGAFDCAYIGGHNLQTIGCTDVELYVSDVTGVEASGTKIYDWGDVSGNADDKPLVSLDLDDAANSNPQRFSSVDYVALKLTVPAAAVPRIGEFWLGRRRQLWNDPRMGHNPDQAMSNVTDVTSTSGVRTRYTRARDQRLWNASFTSSTAAQATIMTSLWSDCLDGTQPLLWIPDPNSAPTVARLMHLVRPNLLGGSHSSSLLRSWTFAMSEVAPFYDRVV